MLSPKIGKLFKAMFYSIPPTHTHIPIYHYKKSHLSLKLIQRKCTLSEGVGQIF